MPTPEPSRDATRLAMWSSLGAALVTAASLAPMVLGDPWTDLPTYAASFSDSRLIIFVCWFLLAVLFVVLVAAVHALAPEARRIWSATGLAFAIMYGAIVGVNYALQFTYVRQRILAGDTAGLEPWVAANPASAVFATDILGYLFQGLSTLALAPLFRGNRVLEAIRGLFVVNGILGFGGLVAISFASAGSSEGQALGTAGLLAWGSLLTVALLLLFVAIRKGLWPGSGPSPDA